MSRSPTRYFRVSKIDARGQNFENSNNLTLKHLEFRRMVHKNRLSTLCVMKKIYRGSTILPPESQGGYGKKRQNFKTALKFFSQGVGLGTFFLWLRTS